MIFLIVVSGCVNTIQSQTDPAVFLPIPENCSELPKNKETRCLWKAKVRGIIAKKWKYPEESRKRGIEGDVGLEFALDLNGKLISSKVTKSSGYKELDDYSMSLISIASPFPKPNFELNEEDFVITLEMSYQLY